MKRTLGILLAVFMLAALFSACNGQPPAATAAPTAATGEVTPTGEPEQTAPASQYDTLVIGVPAAFEEKFNPFYAESAYDQDVMDQIFVAPQMVDATNTLVDWAGNISFEEITAEDGHTQVLYTVKINEGMTFSDGEPVTIDDLLFYFKVVADPSYKGPVTFLASDIVGLQEYYYDDPEYSAVVDGFAAEAEAKYSLEKISEEDYKTYLRESNLEGWWAGIDSYDWVAYLTDEGFDPAGIETDEAALFEMMVDCEYTNYGAYYDPQTWWNAKLKEGYIAGNIEDGIDVAEISGITRVDDYTCTVLFNSVDIYGDRTVSAPLVPEHYYGADFVKGDTSSIEANLDAPIGSGPYIWQGFADNIVTVVANDGYFEGEPKIKTVKWQYVSDADTVAALASGQIDIANPSASLEKINELTAAGLEYDLMDNNGYGYLAINASNVDINVRKGLLHLMNRAPSVEGYYGELAAVIERPMTTTLGEYPTDATVYYEYDPAKAEECFKEAGYTKNDAGELVNGSGEKLVINVYIGGDGVGAHPAYAMLTQAQNDLATLGGELQIQDVQFNVLQAAMNDGSADMFVLAWGASNTCDKSSIYMTGGGQNRTNISNPELDAILKEIPKTIDLQERKAKVAQMLDIVMAEAIELPLYQRKNMLVYNPAVVKMDSLPETSTYWTYENILWQIELN